MYLAAEKVTPPHKYLYWRIAKLTSSTHKGGSLQSGDADIYYELYQSKNNANSETVILLHGGLATIEAWYNQLPTLTECYAVRCIDLRGHGRSTFGSQTTLTYRLMATDVISIMEQLNINFASFVGWSDGADLGLILAVEYPKHLCRLIAISANFHPSGVTSSTSKRLVTHTTETHNLLSKYMYRLLSPESRWTSLWEQVTDIWKTRFQLSVSDLHRIQLPTLLITGEFDDITPEHTQEMHDAIPNSEIHIIPGV